MLPHYFRYNSDRSHRVFVGYSDSGTNGRWQVICFRDVIIRFPSHCSGITLTEIIRDTFVEVITLYKEF